MKLLISADVLVHYDSRKPTALCCYASPYGTWTVLLHKPSDGSQRPVAYASRTLTAAEKKYSRLDRNAASVIFSINQLHQYLYGQNFVIHIDHNSLISLMGRRKGIQQMAAPIINPWSPILSAYANQIHYIHSQRNITADVLNRLLLQDVFLEESTPQELVSLIPLFNKTPSHPQIHVRRPTGTSKAVRSSWM
ncbi:unnamed protein product, partial [Dicrocoelium dendriticum]